MNAARIALLALLPATTASAADLQVAVIIDGVFSEAARDRIAVELDAFERALLAEGSADFAFVTCDKASPTRVSAKPFGTGLRDLSKSVGFACEGKIDLVDYAIEELKWRDDAIKRIAVFGETRELLGANRRSPEEVMFRAERFGIVVHAAELER